MIIIPSRRLSFHMFQVDYYSFHEAETANEELSAVVTCALDILHVLNDIYITSESKPFPIHELSSRLLKLIFICVFSVYVERARQTRQTTFTL